MDAIKYLTEFHRMCIRYCCCKGCPMKELQKEYSNCYAATREKPEEAVPIVEKWSEEHPLVTNGMKVMELIPDNSRLTNDTGEDNVQMVIARGWWDAPYKGE